MAALTERQTAAVNYVASVVRCAGLPTRCQGLALISYLYKSSAGEERRDLAFENVDAPR